MSSTVVEDIIVPLLGALQAALSVLLTIVVGVVAAQFGWLSSASSKEVSQVCVKLFLPALLIYNVGSQMDLASASRYIPIIVWSIIYNAVSIAFGITITNVFGMPSWVTPAIAFNNTTALPLLLIQSLAATDILDSIDPSGGAVDRAKSYLLMNAMIGNSLTFALGPKLLHGQNEDAPVNEDDKDDANGTIDREIEEQESQAEQANEETSLLPNRIAQPMTRFQYTLDKKVQHIWITLPSWAQTILSFIYAFINPPLVGAAIGIFIGLIPALHRLFFNSQESGGYLHAWLTSTIKNVGDLFAALQVIVVGVKLSNSLIHMKHGEASGNVPWASMLTILATRMVLWPAISIPLIYALASKTNWLGDDPILWFCMMLIPTGPPALKLTALADVNGADDEEKMTIAKFLTISYAISPIICFAVVGSLKATQAVTAQG